MTTLYIFAAMYVFDRYVLRNLAMATGFIAVTLAAIVFLTQSLRFLELVIESGASGASFWLLAFLALPRFLEIILPIALLAGIIFIYNRMTIDSELVAIKAAGYSPLQLARPAIMLACVLTVMLWGITMWATPASLSSMQHLRQVIKTQFSALLFREGVFNQAGNGLTVYMRARTSEGELRGLMIHDTRNPDVNPSTVTAKRGVIVARPEGEQVLVFDGSRQEYDRKKGTLHRLNFERYTIDLPASDPVRTRWREPEERTIFELIYPAPNDEARADPKARYEFIVEIHRRIVAPLIALAYTFMTCACLLTGPLDRRGQGRKIAFAIASAITLQALFLMVFSLARETVIGLPLMYFLIVAPCFMAVFFLSGYGEKFRRKILYVGANN
ncbi:MAG: LPS export ABC transporter permease LptF [Alphaproteobacteria bacterium PRO2]|nr:LPS export ABC transporter permease LptF [Alphaproteobacteria bacterium PRO2]